jgi:beta-lactam-binding protein with PASTA domain
MAIRGLTLLTLAAALGFGVGCGGDDPPEGVVPNVVGMTRKQASTAIVEAGLRWRAAKSPVIATKPASVLPDDLVLRQAPSGGTHVRDSEVVVIQTCVTHPGVGCDEIPPDASNAAPLG